MNKDLGIDKTQALIEVGLHIEDPTQLANLAQQIPEGVSLIKVIQSYDTKKPQNKKYHVRIANTQKIIIGVL